MSDSSPTKTTSPNETNPTRQTGLRLRVLSRIFYIQLGLIFLALVFFTWSYYSESRLGSLELSILAGCLGGSLTLLSRIQRLSNIQDLSLWTTTLVPVIASGFMAAIAYLLFLSGLLSGEAGTGLIRSNLFPQFIRPDLCLDEPMNMKLVLLTRPDGVLNFAKLLIWCFLAGYSDRFVDHILRSLEGSAQ